ncbi:MAG: hypothetical protein V3T17_17620 [Pseudomonadales bacterium]
MLRFLLYLGLYMLLFNLHIPVNAASFEQININGYLSFEYEKTISGDDVEDTNGSFDIDLLDLVFNIQATSRLRIATDLTWEHGSATEDDRGNVAVEYAFAEYTLENWLRFRAGKMFTHFGIYNEIHTAKPATLTVKEPLSTNKNNKFGSDLRFYPRWLTGIALQGDVESTALPFDYDIQISNGESIDDSHNPFEEDDNTHKAVNGRIRLLPNDAMRIGFSFYIDSMEDPVNDARVDILSYGAQFEWEMANRMGTEIEYVMGEEDFTTNKKIDRSAYTVMFYHRTTQKIIPYIRYEYLDPDDDTSDDEAVRIIFGVNLFVDDNMYVKVELNDNSTKSNNADFSGADWAELKASLSIGF